MNKTILVVDYEQKSLDEILRLLKDEPFDLLTAFDGSQALEIFEKKGPDLVITSALLPKLNGFELCKKIVSGQHGEVRPVIMFSGIYKAEKYRKEAIVGCGAVDFLEKPLAKWQLLKVVKGLFSEIPGGLGGDLLDLDATPGRSKTAMPLAKPGSETHSFALSDDLLDVESLLGSTPINAQAGPPKETDLSEILDTDTPAPRTVSVKSLDQELDSAVDAVRTDLDSASRLRDQQLAREIETDLFQNGQNILEFESPAEVETGKARVRTSGEAATEVIELEVPAGRIHELASRQTVPATSKGLDSAPAPQFALGSQQSRNWLPLITTIVVGLLIILLLWMRG